VFSMRPHTFTMHTPILLGLLIAFGLHMTSLYNYLLFHSLAEIFSIIIGCGIFMVAWNSRQFLDNNYLLFIGIAYLFVAGIDLTHMFAYKGMNIFKGYETNLPTQLWIAARYIESLSLLIAPIFLGRRLKIHSILLGYGMAFSLLLLSIFYWKIFPICFIEGVGLTPFKKISEYIISLILLASIVLLFGNRKKVDKSVLQYVIWSVILTIVSELAFTFYIHAYGFSNLVGHFFKIASFYLIYKAIIETGLVKPYDLLFRNLKQSEGVLREAKEGLETKVAERTNELRIANEQLQFELTEHNRAEEALRESEKKYRDLVVNALVGIYKTNLNGDILFANEALARIFEFDSPEEMISVGILLRYKNLKDRQALIETLQKEGKVVDYEIEFLTKSGKTLNVLLSATLVGDTLSGMIMDITPRKRAEEEKVALQDQLRQSQKMEAIGRLAGGIAHDFNNLLTIIKGYSQLSFIELKEGDPLRNNIEEIQKASDRAANLTRQVLAFSRRQVLDMKILDVNTILQDLDKMLRRVIGEDIELVTLLSKDLGNVKTDPGQIEQVIMNLAVNARDAMPSGGKLTIETANVELEETYARAHIAVKSGRYAMLSVSDTGVGMTPEVRDRIFEPFFTTKEKGKGTGLGLSTVYGIVKQSEGNIWVYSEPGQGTTFKIYLPRVDEPLEELRQKAVEKEIPRGSETILIVEDDEPVRKLSTQILKRQGYAILEAGNGNEALHLCEERKQPVHLILTDVVMPEMGGRELVKRLKSLHSEMKVIYMSGYTNNAIVHHGVLEKGVNYVQKPFTLDALARKVREVLDG